MRKLTVLFDEACGMCRRARVWLEEQGKYVPLEFVPAGSDEARARFPSLDHDRTLAEYTAIGDGRDVYHGANAWLVIIDPPT